MLGKHAANVHRVFDELERKRLQRTHGKTYKLSKRTPQKAILQGSPPPCGRGGLSWRSNNAYLQHALDVSIKRVRAAGPRDRQAVPHAAAEDADGACV